MPGAPAHPPPYPGSLIPHKRRAPPASSSAPAPPRPPATTTRDRGGRVTCEACGETISFASVGGDFTLDHWDAHRLKCSSAGSPADPTPQSQTHAPPALPPPQILAHAQPPTQPMSDGPPPPKRRRAKRTEDERIHYLRSDPFVAQFEAYRVLCGSCNKWIRLRPNSTYCSIPWDSHRKSCLAKNGKLNRIDAGPAARLPESALGTLAVPPHLPAAPAAGPPRTTAPTPSHSDALMDDGLHDADADADEDDEPLAVSQSPVPGFRSSAISPTMHEAPGASSAPATMPPPAAPSRTAQSPRPSVYPGALPAAASIHSESPLVSTPLPPTPPLHSFPPQHLLLPSALASPSAMGSPRSDHTPDLKTEGDATSSSDSLDLPRRRNADQRLDALRSDPLLSEVEPSRVFCQVCQKWVQLRQDSTYCAYPWVQHRTKCVKRYQRRLDKAAGLIDARHHREDEKPARDEHRARERAPGRRDSNASAMATSDAESEEGVTPEVARRVAEATGWTVHTEPRRGETKGSRPALEIDELMSDTTAVVGSRSTTVPRSRRSSLSTVARLADLDSPTGRLDFIAHSIEYLFSTTYEHTDELTTDNLAQYLNAAMPPEKHEEFDAHEVQQALPDLPGPFARRLSITTGSDGVARLVLEI